ncbi:fungal-specific transcription factor domain-containing protein [Xylogone sp. PMI_703]|nr:fungal-specific transcription factor domain-containing protein [Xylogone sp. PMI_703]
MKPASDGSGSPSGYPNKRPRRESPPVASISDEAKSQAGGGGGGGGGGAGGGNGATASEASPVSVKEDVSAQQGALADTESGGKTGKTGQSSSFRNVSACNRCRLRKNRCDQRLPSCASCDKAGVKCVGYDPITKREIPRSYVFYLESRVDYLEGLLQKHNIPFAPADDLDLSSRPGPEPNTIQSPSEDGRPPQTAEVAVSSTKPSQQELARSKKQGDAEKVEKLVSNLGSIPVQGASDSRYLGSTAGISFARVVFAAVKSSVSGSNSDRSGVRPSSKPQGGSKPGPPTNMRDSFFGLQTKPTIKQAPFPDKDVGRRLVEFYFEHANPQIPILHRGEFMKMFEAAYAEGEQRVRTPREQYMLNIVFAIGGGIFLGDSGEGGERNDGNKHESESGTKPGKQSQPEEYHASAIVHLEACLSAPSSDKGDGLGALKELQAVLLLAGFALLRPVAPGLWYIVGVAVRLAVDLGLHYEDGKDIDVGLEAERIDGGDIEAIQAQKDRERGRRQWIRDFRRRLWWCTYSFDRLVSTCVGRPFGITDQVITTEFPSLLDDRYITPSGFLEPPGGSGEPTYKHASYHYFRLRLLQSEILQVLQHQQAQFARAGGANQQNPYMHTKLPSPFLYKFDSFRSWRIDIDRRLYEWKTSAPTKKDTGVDFSVEFLELNYWQCVIMLYRQSIATPAMFEGEYNTSDEVESPSIKSVELREDEERVFLKVAEAGQRVLRLYRQLHRVHLVNYTFLATHHLFMAGISFLYAIWHSPIVRSRLTMDEVDFTILAATSVLGDLIEKCPPAEACRDAFDRMSKATVQMCMSTTGFGSSALGLNSRREQNLKSNETDYFGSNAANRQQQYSNVRRSGSGRQRQVPPSRPKHQFDMGLNDLFPTSPQSKPRSALNQQPHPPPPPPQQLYRSNSHPTPPDGVKVEYDSYNPGAPIRSPRTQAPPQAHRSPSEYSLSPPLSSLDPNQIDPSLLASPRYIQSHGNPQPSHTSYAGSADLDFSFQGMDFLQGNGFDPHGAGAGGNGNGYGGAGAGMNLGFGLGWEGADHDFSEGGQGVDLFDGFFFGGSGGT